MTGQALRELPPAAGPARPTLRRSLTRALLRSARKRPLVFTGNRIDLLKNGEQYFPCLLNAIDAATESIYLETYIFELDNVGRKVSDALTAAAQRGVAVHVLVDGFGSLATADALISRLRPHGVNIIVFRRTRWWRPERRLLRRLHRKIALIDNRLAFVGGINIIDDHHHPGPVSVRDQLGPRFDFAVACEGPLVAAISFTVTRLWWTMSALQLRRRPSWRPPEPEVPPPAAQGGARAALLLRDNLRNRRTIEHAYLDAFA